MITYENVRDAAAEAYRRCLVDIPKDVLEALKAAREKETSSDAIWAFDNMLLAVETAKKQNMTFCEDIGVPSMDVRIGTETKVPRDMEKALNDGMALMSKNMGIRNIDLTMPVDKKTKTPGPIIRWESMVGKDYVELIAVPKGGGTEPKSAAKTLDPSTPAYIKKWLLDTIAEIGPIACPPYTIGLGIGGNLALVGQLSMLATLRPVNMWNKDPEAAKMEQELTDAVNQLGWGPMGVGGKTSCLAVHIEQYGTSPRWSPVGFTLKCWPNRRGVVKITNDGKIQVLDYPEE
ncbi:fumarate hydratase [Chloroflexota bacterium]